MAFQLDIGIQSAGQVFEDFYNRIASAKSPSFWMTTFSASFTNLRVLLLQSRDSSYYASRRILTSVRSDCKNALIYAHTVSHNPPTFDTSLGLLTLPAPEPGDFVELILVLYCTFPCFQYSWPPQSLCLFA